MQHWCDAQAKSGSWENKSLGEAPEPLRIGPPPDVVPEGHKRCLKCHQVKPVAEYYDRLNRCRACIRKECMENYAKRKAARRMER